MDLDIENLMKAQSLVLLRLEEVLILEQENSERLTRIEACITGNTTEKFECPICKTPMVKRQSSTGILFLGCRNFPKCRGSRSATGVDTSPRGRNYQLKSRNELSKMLSSEESDEDSDRCYEGDPEY